MRRTLLRPTLAAVALVAFCGCAFGGCATLGLQRPGTVDAPEVVKVVLTDASIDVWPGLVGRGKVGLEIVNEGQLEHGFRVVGAGLDEQSDQFLIPGQRRVVWLKLEPGTYRVSCPDGDHAERGMRALFAVTERPSWFRR